jgi:hypothetical protein
MACKIHKTRPLNSAWLTAALIAVTLLAAGQPQVHTTGRTYHLRSPRVFRHPARRPAGAGAPQAQLGENLCEFPRRGDSPGESAANS